MYTGIVTHKLPVEEILDQPGLRSFVFLFPPELLDGLQKGASVSVSGVCLTVNTIDGDRVSFDAMEETLNKTTLGGLSKGQTVNILRSATIGGENGGHDMFGHVAGTAEIVAVDRPDNNCVMTFRVPQDWMKFILQKGFIGLDGCSLTVTDPDSDAGTFQVWFIPETLSITTFGEKDAGDKVNVEIDAKTQTIVETVERVLAAQGKA